MVQVAEGTAVGRVERVAHFPLILMEAAFEIHFDNEGRVLKIEKFKVRAYRGVDMMESPGTMVPQAVVKVEYGQLVAALHELVDRYSEKTDQMITGLGPRVFDMFSKDSRVNREDDSNGS